MTTSDQKKAALAAFVIMAFIAYSVVMRHDDSHTVVTPNTTPQSNLTASGSSSTSATSATSGTTASNTASTSHTYKDGTYTGSVADAFYGNIQVQVTVQGGKITDVTFLQYPNDRPNSVAINQQTMPYLKQEAIQAQSARVDGVSGATDTSQAFIQSLSAALAKAS